jgi:hypothetical protein
VGFLKGIKLSTFLDCYQEWHAFVEGLCEVLCPWPARHNFTHKKLLKDIQAEHHYYVFGRAMGVIAWLIIAAIIKEVFFG